MKARLAGEIAGAFLAVVLGVCSAFGQTPAPVTSDRAASQFTAEQLDQLLAPIALYPDPLLSQILMAATYPLEVVEADRWIQEPKNATLKGEQLASAAAQQRWDPSVKSLVPFPQLLHLMDRNLEWTERLGDAVLADQAAVMESVQRLRKRAEAAGKLRSTPQQAVTMEGEAIAIEPPSPDMVYVPVYNPSVIYGEWPYPAYPPYYFPDYFDGVLAGELGVGWLGVAVVAPLWGWTHCNWLRHEFDIDHDRFAAINHDRPPIGNGVWQHDPSHRHGVPYRDPISQAKFVGRKGASETQRSIRGYPTGAVPQVHRLVPTVEHPSRVAPSIPQRVPPTFESFGRGSEVRTQIERGRASRMSMPMFTPRMSVPHFAPSFGGGRR
jgi:hypothetical protein